MKPIEAHSTAGIRAKMTREEQAARELGHTEFAPGTRTALVVVFVAAIAFVPGVQFLAGVRNPGRLARVGAEVRALLPSRAQVRAVDGVADVVGLLPPASQLKRVEEEWEESSVVGQALLPRVQSLLLRLGHGNEKVYVGRDGWLFYRPDVDYVTGAGFVDPRAMKRRTLTGGALKPPQPDPMQAIVEFRDQLAARGIALIVVPAPVKPSLYPECYAGRSAGTSGIVQNTSFEDFKRRLTLNGVVVFDPAPGLAQEKGRTPDRPLYLKTDTHWTPAAMEWTAGRLAETVRRAVALPPAMTGRFTAVEKVVDNAGDVAMMLKLPAGAEDFPRETVRIRQVLDGGGLWRRDPNARILFLGDSFANIYSLDPMGWGEAAGLVEHLSLALGLPVDAICRNDAGSYATREMLAQEMLRGSDRLAEKKVVLWEFASRELAFGDWKRIPLALGEKKLTGFYAPPADRTAVARGVVRAVSSAPRPGSVPYKDHILMIHLTDLESADDPSAAGREAVVFAWSMCDNKAMPASRHRPGDAVRLRVRPWSAVASKYEKINRSELDDERLLLADPVWGEESGPEARDGSSADGRAGAAPGRGPETGRARPDAGLRPDGAAAEGPRLAAGDAAAFRETCASRAAAGDSMALPGRDGWLFLRSELRHIGAGPFWGEAAARVSKATSPDKADPLPAILDFNGQLNALGIELILAPVPCKALVYPEKLDGGTPERPDAVHQQFLRLLGDKGVKVLDLAGLYWQEKGKPGSPLLYCKTDTHWSPFACEVTARAVRKMIGVPAWLNGMPDAFRTRPGSRTITGDLTDGRVPEELPVRIVEAPGAALEDRASPILLLGDSHTLVFHAGADMHGTGAGLADQLAAELGLPVDVIGVRGSGATPARVNLMRRARGDPAYLAGKKVVLWCFAAREFTESTGWSMVKLSR